MANLRSKTIKIRKYNLIDARVEKRFKKWKLIICQWINIPVLHNYNFIYSIDYYGRVQLKKDDVLVDQRGVKFMVASAGNKMATIITHEPKSEQPKMHGVFHVINQEFLNKQQNKKED